MSTAITAINVAEKIAEAARESHGKGLPAPAGYQVWAEKYFKQPACGEMIFEAPIHFNLENPQAAIGWYETHIGQLPEEEKELLLNNKTLR